MKHHTFIIIVIQNTFLSQPHCTTLDNRNLEINGQVQCFWQATIPSLATSNTSPPQTQCCPSDPTSRAQLRAAHSLYWNGCAWSARSEATPDPSSFWPHVQGIWAIRVLARILYIVLNSQLLGEKTAGLCKTAKCVGKAPAQEIPLMLWFHWHGSCKQNAAFKASAGF